MTEQEARVILESEIKHHPEASIFAEALNEAIVALEEIQQYRAIGKPEELKRLKENGAFTGMELAQIAIMQMELKKYIAIGTPEECLEAVEKQKAKKPRRIGNATICPNCPKIFKSDSVTYCPNCGQKIDWR